MTGVVAIGRNEGERMVRRLRSPQSTDCPIAYVESASNFDGAKATSKRGALVVRFDTAIPFTSASARAEGFAPLGLAHPSLFFLFLDGDYEIEPSLLENGERFLVDTPDNTFVCGRRRERSPQASQFNSLIDREWAGPADEARAHGGDAVYRSDAYRAVGSFDPRMLAGEEPELCIRMRAAGWLCVLMCR